MLNKFRLHPDKAARRRREKVHSKQVAKQETILQDIHQQWRIMADVMFKTLP